MAKILLQFPEGLKPQALKYAEKYAGEGEIIISASPCFGACDVAIDEALKLGVDKIVHFGHNAFLKSPLPIEVEYVPYRIDIPLENLRKAGEALAKEVKSIALVTTVQHSHQIKEMKAILSDYLTVKTGKGFWAREEGQILGCDITAGLLDTEAILYVGSGRFHPMAFVDAYKRVFSFDPFSSSLAELSQEIEKFRKKKKAITMRAYSAESFGVIVSTKPGQYRKALADWAINELRKRGKKAYLITTNHVFPSALENLSFDAYVNTACPRLIDDYENYSKPLLNIDMLANLFALWEGREFKRWLYWVGNKREK